ncbi:MAG: hypothetical protein J3Q66DRAFT_418223 [Benniella sp.]|nr:MAG: hypothetical protein J3Q66DRAFT_418223 [Benniella sp.]
MSANDTTKRLQPHIHIGGPETSKTNRPTYVVEAYRLNTQDRVRTHSADTPSKTLDKKTQAVNAVIQRPPVQVSSPTFRLILYSTEERKSFAWTMDIESATVSALKRSVFPTAAQPENDNICIVIHHLELPSFPPRSIERLVGDDHLRVILQKYNALNIMDLVVDLETPDKGNEDFTTSDADCWTDPSRVVGIVTFHDNIRTALAQNRLQFESTMGMTPPSRSPGQGQKRKHDEEISTRPWGIITDGIQWRFIHYTLESSGAQTLPTYHISKIPGYFQYDLDKNWREDTERIFTHIVCLTHELTVGLTRGYRINRAQASTLNHHPLSISMQSSMPRV